MCLVFARIIPCFGLVMATTVALVALAAGGAVLAAPEAALEGGAVEALEGGAVEALDPPPPQAANMTTNPIPVRVPPPADRSKPDRLLNRDRPGGRNCGGAFIAITT
jgi:hypothetical protein